MWVLRERHLFCRSKHQFLLRSPCFACPIITDSCVSYNSWYQRDFFAGWKPRMAMNKNSTLDRYISERYSRIVIFAFGKWLSQDFNSASNHMDEVPLLGRYSHGVRLFDTERPLCRLRQRRNFWWNVGVHPQPTDANVVHNDADALMLCSVYLTTWSCWDIPLVTFLSGEP